MNRSEQRIARLQALSERLGIAAAALGLGLVVQMIAPAVLR